MRWWDTIRTAWNLSESVQQLRADFKETIQRFDELESEWTDVLDKLKARDERQRKRDQRALKRDLADNAGDPPPNDRTAGASSSDKEALRELARARGFIR